MATLRVLPSLLNQPQNLVASREITSKKRLSLGRLPNHVKLCSPIRASLVPGLSDSDERGSREEFGVERCDGVGEESGGFLATGAVERFVRENARELAIGGLVFALVCLPDERALALGPGGPLMEEFWDNVRRYGFYFFTVVSGGLYSLTKPLLDLLKNPSTQILVLIAVIGTFYLMYLTVSTMLGLNDFVYEYAQ
jgi:hypothetical protein